MDRGVDGLKSEDLRSGRERWWDRAFTDALLRVIPKDANVLVEIGCGLGRVATEILPLAPRLSYIGVDLDDERITECRQILTDASLAERARVVMAHGEDLPFESATADVVLTAMTLQHVPNPLDVLGEAMRILRSGGVVVAAEPDNLSQRWYFDGLLEDLTEAFIEVVRKNYRARLPANLAIGPTVPSLMRQAGLQEVEMFVHTVYTSHFQSAQACAEKWQNMLQIIAEAGGLPKDCPEVVTCEQTIKNWLYQDNPQRQGQSGDLVPVFITTGYL